MLIYTAKLTMLLLSLSGYIFFVHRKGIELSFSPILSVSCISLAMFLAGLLNIMPLAAISLLLGGLFLLYKNRNFRLSRDQLAVTVFFLACYIFFAFRLRNTQVSWYDNFSHWATVVRDMLKTNHLPNFNSYLIDFQSYPTVGSGFLYFICKILGNNEGAMLFGQFLILLGCLCPFFAFLKPGKTKSVPLAFFWRVLPIFCVSAFLLQSYVWIPFFPCWQWLPLRSSSITGRNVPKPGSALGF